MTKDSLRSAEFNQFLTPSGTELTEFIEEAMPLGDKFPAIHMMMADDQDALARGRKKPGFSTGSMRMPKSATFPVLISAALRSPRCIGLRKADRDACERMRDSMTLHILFSKMGVKIPGATTIIENSNCVPAGTREFILSCQLRQILDDGLDDFSEVQLDSTSVSTAA